MRRVVVGLVAVALVIGALPAAAGVWDKVKQEAREAKEDVKKGSKEAVKDVVGSGQAAASGSKKAAKDAWGNVSKSVKDAAD